MKNDDLDGLRWWVFAKTEESARQIVRQTRERNAALGFDRNHGLTLL